MRSGGHFEYGAAVVLPAILRRAEQVAIAAGEQAGFWIAPFVSLNVASVLSAWVPAANLNTVPLLFAPPAPVVPYRLPLASAIRPALGSPVRAVERSQGGEGVGAGGQLEYCADVIRSTIIRRAIQVAAGVGD